MTLCEAGVVSMALVCSSEGDEGQKSGESGELHGDDNNERYVDEKKVDVGLGIGVRDIRENVGVERVTVGARRPDGWDVGTRGRWRERERRELVDHDGDDESATRGSAQFPIPAPRLIRAAPAGRAKQTWHPHPNHPRRKNPQKCTVQIHPILTLLFLFVSARFTAQKPVCLMRRCHDVVAKRYAYLSSTRVGANVCRI